VFQSYSPISKSVVSLCRYALAEDAAVVQICRNILEEDGENVHALSMALDMAAVGHAVQPPSESERDLQKGSEQALPLSVAEELCARLEKADPIRSRYWQFRRQQLV
jgi:hypothetical protein